jgi:hypothetical protein
MVLCPATIGPIGRILTPATGHIAFVRYVNVRWQFDRDAFAVFVPYSLDLTHLLGAKFLKKLALPTGIEPVFQP